MLEIKNLHAGIDGKEILKGIDLKIGKGEIHAVMGPNGAGKSTLGAVLTGRPGYEVTEGTVLFEGESRLQPTASGRESGLQPALFLYIKKFNNFLKKFICIFLLTK